MIEPLAKADDRVELIPHPDNPQVWTADSMRFVVKQITHTVWKVMDLENDRRWRISGDISDVADSIRLRLEREEQ